MLLACIFALAFLCCVMVLSLAFLASLKWREQPCEGRVQVIVLGDLGRSPRMQYHCLSLLQNDLSVELIGYDGMLALKS